MMQLRRGSLDQIVGAILLLCVAAWFAYNSLRYPGFCEKLPALCCLPPSGAGIYGLFGSAGLLLGGGCLTLLGWSYRIWRRGIAAYDAQLGGLSIAIIQTAVNGLVLFGYLALHLVAGR